MYVAFIEKFKINELLKEKNFLNNQKRKINENVKDWTREYLENKYSQCGYFIKIHRESIFDKWKKIWYKMLFVNSKHRAFFSFISSRISAIKYYSIWQWRFQF